MKIAIIDGVNQDIGLKILFPDADYFINNIEIDKSYNHNKYNIKPNTDWSLINDINYDYLFIIIALYDAKKGTRFFKQNIYDILQREIEIINNNNFKKVFIFDNYDYDYDPNEILSNEKITLFFKRNYNKTKKYNTNVVSFPFIMFGEVSIIEKLENQNENQIQNQNENQIQNQNENQIQNQNENQIQNQNENQIQNQNENQNQKINRIFFTGTLFEHNDSQIHYYRNRIAIYEKIKHFIYNPGYLSYNDFLQNIRESKFALDLNGVGEPNKRTFEILSSGSLRIGEYNDLKWPFDEEFSEETIFKNESDFLNKISILSNNETHYNSCLSNQRNIYDNHPSLI
jgi:hypothetical protein